MTRQDVPKKKTRQDKPRQILSQDNDERREENPFAKTRQAQDKTR